jgi:predicted nucleic acid-binding protein
LTVYLDASFLAGLFIRTDAFASRATAFSKRGGEPMVVSDFATAEFSSVIARLTRMNNIQEPEARDVFRDFDAWRYLFAEAEDAISTDIRAATAIIRRLDLNIRAPDAINLAIAMRLGASIATFDHGMAQNAQTLGITVATV